MCTAYNYFLQTRIRINLAKFVSKPPKSKCFSTTTTHTDLSQRETLEAIIVNLCDHIGIEVIYKQVSSGGGVFYSAGDHRGPYQSATNTIFSLANQLQDAAK